MSFFGLLTKAEFQNYLDRKLKELETKMSAREDASREALTATIETVKAGWTALQAENKNLKDQLTNAGVEFQAALDADSEADADKVDAANASLSELVAPPVEEPTTGENPPAEEPATPELPAEQPAVSEGPGNEPVDENNPAN